MVRVHADSHRPVVDEFHGHVRTESAGFNGAAEVGFQAQAEVFVERDGDVVARCADVGGAVPFLVGGHQRELAHDKQLAAHVDNAAVHDAVRVVEDAERQNFSHEPVGIVPRVRGFDAEEDKEALPDAGLLCAGDSDGCAAHALNNSSHRV